MSIMSIKSAGPLPQYHGRIAILFGSDVDVLAVTIVSLRKPSTKSRVSMYLGQIIGKYINHQESPTIQHLGRNLSTPRGSLWV